MDAGVKVRRRDEEVGQGVRAHGRGEQYRVAKGLEETCGRERNSSRSIVPELSYEDVRESVDGRPRRMSIPCPAS